ncbi:hypothetical protein [Nocardioides sp. TF02-7]|uniref:hypothetical protein n=1 Tax=Nocardioides sp. TF02-7 TaxID=2917724 RepID=UPI001F0556AB|nr:hypothetical protein [Nocardioides sp. TF02-7]UMG94269.1 hypothetical protein MF408_09765 [Nocardioides sp. TF02-7]
MNPVTTSRPRPAAGPVARPAPPAPRWARTAAHVAALTPLPSALWRVALALGFSAGYTEAGLEELDLDLVGTLWLLGLSAVTEGAALLTLVLVRPWREGMPRRVPPRWVVRAGWAGVVVLALLWTQLAFWWHVPHDDLTPTGTTVVGLLYLPMVAWAPLLAAVTIDYRRRHRCC